MKKQTSLTKLNIAFIVIFVLILVLPVCFINTKPFQVSEMENKTLAEWPGLSWTMSTDTALEEYVNDRIGFREEAIVIYTRLHDWLFDVMIHPLFMYGRDGHIFYKDKDYVTAYQHLNTDEEYLDSFVGFLQDTKDYLDGKDIRFLYYLCPDKKTIYGEYFPETINVDTTRPSVLLYLKDKLAETDIDYVVPDAELLEAKQNGYVYNRMYDATHWNEDGAFLGHTLADAYVQEWFDDVKPLSMDDYTREMVEMDSLDIAKFPIHEQVPLISLKNDTSSDATSILEPFLQNICYTTTFYSHYINENVPNNRVLLVFTDSYFQAHQKYYNNRFREVYFVHRQNYDYLQYFVNLVFPDMVIFETAERSISSEFPLLCDFTDYMYEPSYTELTGMDVNALQEALEEGSIQEASEIGLYYDVIDAVGVRPDMNDHCLYVNPFDGEGIACVNALLCMHCDDYWVYIKTADEIIETDYCKQHRDADAQCITTFSINIQRRFMSQQTLSLIAVDINTGEQYLLDTLEVTYGR